MSTQNREIYHTFCDTCGILYPHALNRCPLCEAKEEIESLRRRLKEADPSGAQLQVILRENELLKQLVRRLETQPRDRGLLD